LSLHLVGDAGEAFLSSEQRQHIKNPRRGRAPCEGGAKRLRKLSVRFAGMVEPGDTVTFTADEVAEGKLQIKAVNQHGDVIISKGAAEFVTGRGA